MPPTTAVYGGLVPGWVLFWLVVVIAGVYFLYRVSILVRLMLTGQPDYRLESIGERIIAVLVYVLGQGRMFRYPGAGLMHALIFWGFIVILLATMDMFGKGLFLGNFALPILDRNPVFLIVLELFGLLVTGAVLFAFYRRLVSRPRRLSFTGGALLILGLILALMITDFLADGFRITRYPDPAVDIWSPVGLALAGLFAPWDPNVQVVSYSVFWWAHALLILFFLMYIPHSKHLHIVSAVFNVFLRSLNKSTLPPMDLEKAEAFGVSKVEHLTWKDILDAYTCTECGRCTDNCPAYATDKPLSPKHVILDLRDQLLAEKAPGLLHGGSGEGKEHRPGLALVGEVISDETLWACTTCRACMEECPVFVEHIPKIVQMRRHLVLEESRFPRELKPLFDNLERRGNPWEIPASTRADWAQGLDIKTLAQDRDVEYLYYVGCFGSFDERNKKVSVALAKTLQASGISFAILGPEEKCTGDPARRCGNEYLYQMLAQENIATLKRYGVRKIITQCPHCFSTFKNDYPQLGGSFEVIHHTQLLAQLVAQGKLRPSRPVDGTVTFHDPCYLGRHNDVYSAPRGILQAIPGLKLVEMPRAKSKSFCCGGGGGRAFMEERTPKRVNWTRVAEAADTGAATIGAACPYCVTMFEDGLKGKGLEETMKVKDCVEFLSEAL